MCLLPRFFIRNQEISVDLLVDKEHGAIAEELLLALAVPRLAKDFASEVYNGMYRLLTKGKKPTTWKEEIDYDRQALEYRRSIMIRI